MHKALALTALAALVASASAAAAEDEVSEYARSGPYVGGGLALGISTFGNDPLGLEASLLSDLEMLEDDVGAELELFSTTIRERESVGGLARIGYRILPRLAFEVEGEYQATGFDDEQRDDLDVDIETIVGTGNAKVFLLTDRIQPWLSLGAGVLYAEAEGSAEGRAGPLPGSTPQVPLFENRVVKDTRYELGFAMRFGGGFDYYATERVVVSMGVSYVLPFGSVDELRYVTVDLLSLGIRF